MYKLWIQTKLQSVRYATSYMINILRTMNFREKMHLPDIYGKQCIVCRTFLFCILQYTYYKHKKCSHEVIVFVVVRILIKVGKRWRKLRFPATM